MLDKILSKLGFKSKVVVGIEDELVSDLVGLAEGHHPNEALCFLTGTQLSEFESFDIQSSLSPELFLTSDNTSTQYLLTGFYIIPSTQSGPTKAQVNYHNIPITGNVLGSFHTHPNGVTKPSSADKNMFHRYPVNIIMGYPYTETSWEAYNVSRESVDKIELPVFSNVHKK